MLAAALVPCPPILVPAIAAGAAPKAAPVLAACDAAVSALIAEAPELIVCVGPGRTSTRHRPGAWGTLSGFGTSVPAPGHHHVGRAHLPLSLTIGRWLLDRAGWPGRVIAQEIAPDASAAECLQIGARLRDEVSERSCWLVLGDGSSMRGRRAPDATDESQAAAFDESLIRLLSCADLAALAAMDTGVSEAVASGGRPAWQALTGAVAGRSTVTAAQLRYSGEPFGVGYVVASWWLMPASGTATTATTATATTASGTATAADSGAGRGGGAPS